MSEYPHPIDASTSRAPHTTPRGTREDERRRRHTELETRVDICICRRVSTNCVVETGRRDGRGTDDDDDDDDDDRDGDGDKARARTTGDGEWWCAWRARGACAWGGARTAHAYGCGERAEDERNDVVEQGQWRREQHE